MLRSFGAPEEPSNNPKIGEGGEGGGVVNRPQIAWEEFHIISVQYYFPAGDTNACPLPEWFSNEMY